MIEFRPENNRLLNSGRRFNLLLPVAILWGSIILLVLGWYWFETIYYNPNNRLFLLPWVLATGAVLLAPGAYLYYKGEFDLFHPLVFGVWSYLFPGFFIGGLILASGIVNPHFLLLIQDESADLPLALVYVMLGYIGLVAGFYLPLGRKVGNFIERKLPDSEWDTEKAIMPGLLLLVIGMASTIWAFISGIIGFQRAEEIGQFDGLLFMLTLFWLQSTFLLWLCIFKAPKLTPIHYFTIVILLVTSLSKSAFQGNRGSLIQIFILVAFAFVLSGRRIKTRHLAVGSVLLTIALIFGMIYGTTFRTIKTTEATVSMEEYASYVVQTFEKISEENPAETLERGFSALAERFESVTSLAIIVSNYEKLATYEEQYGISNNIINELTTFFIPRAIWRDKPVVIDAYRYGDLYFNYDANAFAMAPMGDLLRNFGPIGVPLGMMVIGIIMRIFYVALREKKGTIIWRAVLFYMLLTAISYESGYSGIIPYLIKVGVIGIIGLLIVRFFLGKPGVGHSGEWRRMAWSKKSFSQV
jgi:hypothetical protein